MSPADAQEDARGALAVLCAEDAYATAQDGHGAAPLDVPLDPRLEAQWALRGHLVANDTALWHDLPFVGDGERVWYGWLLERRRTSEAMGPGQFALVVRGTQGWVEWLDDGLFLPRRAHPVAGEVESGFWSIYASMTFRLPGGGELPLITALANAIGAGSVTVGGHSLGTALATYLAFDLARSGGLGPRVSARLFAPPRPGDAAFSAAFGLAVPNHRAHVYSRDLVPKVPAGLGYCSVSNVFEITPESAEVIVEDCPTCNHHLACYMAMLDRTILDEQGVFSAADSGYLSCIKL